MPRILLISDNHSYFDQELIPFVSWADEVWHAGDIGHLDSVAYFEQNNVFRAVYGNIDDHITRRVYPEFLTFYIDGVLVYMTHIGGHPQRYANGVKKTLKDIKPNIFICGHSHICRVMYDKNCNLIYMNPGAYGHHGFHHIRTILKFEINHSKIENLEVVELGLRGKMSSAHFKED